MTPREARLQRLYGIGEEDYEALLSEQGGVCAICSRPPGKIRLAVDHHHKSGILRGLLCSWCNYHVLGGGKDSAKLHEDAAFYLTDPPAQRVLPGARVPKGK